MSQSYVHTIKTIILQKNPYIADEKYKLQSHFVKSEFQLHRFFFCLLFHIFQEFGHDHSISWMI